MNIALFLEQPFDPNAGGVQRSTSKLAEIYKKNGHKVILISSSVKPSPISTWLDIPIYHINTKKDHAIFKQILENEKISLIINQSGYSIKWTKFLVKNKIDGVKILSLLRINPSNFRDNYKESIGLFFRKRNLSFLNIALVQKIWLLYHIYRIRYEFNYIISKTDAFVMLSERFKNDLYSMAPLLKRYDKKIYGIMNPFESPNLDIQEIVKEKENIILFVGRLNIVQKRVDLLIEIWKKLHETLPEWKFWVVGYGESRAMMEDYCNKNELTRVTFFGKDNPIDYYKKAKIFHMTSAYEGFGNVLIESQSYGCVPFLFNSYSSAQDIITDKVNGILIEPFDVDTYASETFELANSSSRLTEMGIKAYENVDKFSYEKMYNKWKKIFENLNISNP